MEMLMRVYTQRSMNRQYCTHLLNLHRDHKYEALESPRQSSTSTPGMVILSAPP